MMATASSESVSSGAPSKTAQIVAAVRADVYKYHDAPVYKDDLAIHFTGPFWRSVLANRILRNIVVNGFLAKVFPTSPSVVLRAVFGEEQIEQAMAAGIDQYVILGAGYDTFAMRRPDLLDSLTIYELDQAATQLEKFRRMAKGGIPKPRNTHYIAADLSKEDLFEVLVNAGLDPARPAVFSWFGVTYYLTPDAVTKTLKTISNRMAAGSYVLFDYLADLESTPPNWRVIQEKSAAFVAKRDEPWLTSFDPAQLPAYLEEQGYNNIDHLAPQEITGRYLVGRTDIAYPEFIGFCRSITVGSSDS